MYNEELKTRFLDAHTGWNEASRKHGQNTFERTAPIEEHLQRDVCTMEYEQVVEVLNHASGFRAVSRKEIANFLLEYSRWCVSAGIDGALLLDASIRNEDSTSCKGALLSSPEHLKRILDALYPQPDEETSSLQRRCFLWFGFSGVRSEDVTLIKTDDVDLGKREIRTPHGKFEYPKEGTLDVQVCVSSRAFAVPYNDTVRSRWRYPSDQVLRGIKAEGDYDTIRKVLSREISKALKEGRIDTKVSYDCAVLSGVFWRVLVNEHLGKPKALSLETELRRIIGEPERRVEGTNRYVDAGEERAFRATSKLYMRDYYVWKNTFHS